MPDGADPEFFLVSVSEILWEWGQERFIRDEEESLDVVVHFNRTKQALVRGPGVGREEGKGAMLHGLVFPEENLHTLMRVPAVEDVWIG